MSWKAYAYVIHRPGERPEYSFVLRQKGFISCLGKPYNIFKDYRIFSKALREKENAGTRVMTEKLPIFVRREEIYSMDGNGREVRETRIPLDEFLDKNPDLVKQWI